MRIAKRLLIVWCVWAFTLSVYAQSLKITRTFEAIPNSSVSALYKNEFGKWEKPLLDDTFPYALIRVGLEGNEREVTAAKQKLGLYLGRLHMPLEKLTDKPNELLFLIPAGAGHVEIQCGDGCTNQTIIDLPRLQSNMVYYGKVHYTPMEDPVLVTTTQAPKRQFFKFRVTPTNAIVEIDVNGQKDMWHISDGVASKPLNYGTYRYTISASRYHTESGEFSVSDTETEKNVVLRPKFGWLSIASSTVQGAYAYVTNTTTGMRQSLGAAPINKKDLYAGVYSLLIQKDKYKDYTATITIEEGKTTTLNPTLEENFVHLTLTTTTQSDIYIDGQKLGVGRWSGTLELGEYSVETRQECHQSAYTTLRVTPQSAGKAIALNNPVPIYGSIMLTSSPADAVVYVDGKKVGTTPVIVNELLIGKHTVRMEKEGFNKQVRTVHIVDNQESVLDFELIKAVAKESVIPMESNNHEYVDLGLSVKWATCNVGATRPEEAGDYFAWGETKPNSTCSWSTYKWCSYDAQTKYNTKSMYGIVDNKKTLELRDDAARVNRGGSWRMPTYDEWTELRNNCTWKWTTQNGVNGYKVTSKKNGKSIFLPAVGYREGSSLSLAGSDGYYWSSSLYADYPYYAWSVYFNSGCTRMFYNYRYCGRSVRPVCQ